MYHNGAQRYIFCNLWDILEMKYAMHSETKKMDEEEEESREEKRRKRNGSEEK